MLLARLASAQEVTACWRTPLAFKHMPFVSSVAAECLAHLLMGALHCTASAHLPASTQHSTPAVRFTLATRSPT
jgi:hypothetical protein